MQVEVYVQDYFHESSPLEAINFGEKEDLPISSQMWENYFKSWMETLQPHIPSAKVYELGLRLTNDVQMQVLNTQYRHQNQPTDVLSFAELEVDVPKSDEIMPETSLYLGDIVISVDTAKRQAEQQGHSLSTELTWLAAHGLLHLLGWDHPDEETELQMLHKQVILLRAIGICLDIE